MNKSLFKIVPQLPKIEKGIPIPKPQNETGVTSILRSMGIGDSVLFPHNIRNSIYASASRCMIKIVIRSEGEKLRVWRIK